MSTAAEVIEAGASPLGFTEEVEVPGVEDAAGAMGPVVGVVVIGSPEPGVLFVVQPKAAREIASVAAAIAGPRLPFEFETLRI